MRGTDKDETVVKYSVLKATLTPALSRPRARGQVSSLSPRERVRVRDASLIEEIEREKAMIVRERGERYG
jgi:hypothetical protein